MTKKACRQQISHVLISIAFAFALILGQITFGGAFNRWGWTIGGQHLGKTWVLGAMAKYVFAILTDAALMWGLVAWTHKVKTVATTIKFWLLTLATGITLLALVIASGVSLWPSGIYNTIFIISRNAYPMLTGIIVWLLAQSWLQKVEQTQAFSRLFWGVLGLDLLYKQDIFKLGNGSTFTGVLVLGMAAILLQQTRVRFVNSRAAVVAVGCGGLGTLAWGWIQVSRSSVLADALRLISALSPFTLIPAMVLVQFALKLGVAANDDSSVAFHWPDAWQYLPLVGALLTMGVDYRTFANWTLKFLQPVFSGLKQMWIAGAAVALTGLCAVIAISLYWLVPKLKIWQRCERYWQVDIQTCLQMPKREWTRIGKRLVKTYRRPVFSFVMLWVLNVVAALLMNRSFTTVENLLYPNDNIFTRVLFTDMPNMLMATLVTLTFYWVLVALTNRYWVSLITTGTGLMVFAIANRLKLLSRSEPVVPSDIAELKSVKELLGMVSPIVLGIVIVGLLLIIVGVIWLEKHAFGAQQSLIARGLKLLLAGAFAFSLVNLNKGYSPTANLLSAFHVQLKNNRDMLYFAQSNGPVLSFLSQLNIKTITQPTGYSKQTVSRIVTKYRRVAEQINQTRTQSADQLTVLFNLSESYANPARISGLKLNRSPLPYVSSLMKKTTSGSMMSFGYGGGTANMEYMSLTGFSMANFTTNNVIPNTQVVPKQRVAPNVGNLFHYASAIHPYYGGFYNRQAVYHKYGFNKFAFLGSKYPIIDKKAIGTSEYYSDETAYANAMEQINARTQGQFINLITIQNHMPYNQDWYPDHDYHVSGKGFEATNKTAIENYVQGLAYTDKAVKQFKEKLDRLDKPVIWVFYGDHLPGLYNLPTSVEKYATDYFVYANKYAQKHGATSKLNGTQYVGTNDFEALALKQANAKVNAYTALLTRVQEELPAIWLKADDSTSLAAQRFVNAQGKVVTYASLSAKQRALFREYRMIQYDVSGGKQYSVSEKMNR